MRLLILGGFLGSGKTSLLMRLARHMTDASGGTAMYRVVILENEVGREGVDDRLLRSSGYQVENLFAGCACCTVGGKLITAVSAIERDYGPDWMILETTGLAYPGLIRDNLRHALGKESRICTVADASRWARLKVPMAELLAGQISCADTVLINKADLAGEEALRQTEKEISGMNPGAGVYRVSALQDIPSEIWDRVLGCAYPGGGPDTTGRRMGDGTKKDASDDGSRRG